MHVIENSMCQCRHQIEDAEHLFFDCPLYAAERMELVDTVSQITEFTLHTLLNGDDELSFEDNCKIFCAVHKFLDKSGRF